MSDAGSRGPYSQFDPHGLHAAIGYAARFGKPIYITVNGLPDADDDQRPGWLLAHLAALYGTIARANRLTAESLQVYGIPSFAE